MTAAELAAFLNTCVDAYGHSLGGEHYEHHEAIRNPGETPEIAMKRVIKEWHMGYFAKICIVCHEPFILGRKSSDEQCGAIHGAVA